MFKNQLHFEAVVGFHQVSLGVTSVINSNFQGKYNFFCGDARFRLDKC